MQYLLMIYEDEATYAAEQALQEVVAAHMRLVSDMMEAGVFVAGSGLQPTATATTIRRSGHERLVHDGPFPESREQLGGYYLIEAPDLDGAIAWARKIPVADGGAVEVRPLAVY